MIGTDTDLSARILRVVNSPLYSQTEKITSVGHALSQLNAGQIQDVILIATIVETLDDLQENPTEMHKFWHSSVYCAVVAQYLAAACGAKQVDKIFVVGLLHNIGHFLMQMCDPETLHRTHDKAQRHGLPRFQVERSIFGFDYAQLGSDILKPWGLSPARLATISDHAELRDGSQTPLETAIVHIASLLVNAELENIRFGRGCFAVNPTAWDITGLSEEQGLDICQIATEMYQDVAGSLQIGNLKL